MPAFSMFRLALKPLAGYTAPVIQCRGRTLPSVNPWKCRALDVFARSGFHEPRKGFSCTGKEKQKEKALTSSLPVAMGIAMDLQGIPWYQSGNSWSWIYLDEHEMPETILPVRSGKWKRIVLVTEACIALIL
jgi:hypothetical protein